VEWISYVFARRDVKAARRDPQLLEEQKVDQALVQQVIFFLSAGSFEKGALAQKHDAGNENRPSPP
jgi:hypothetical protein